MSVIFLSGHNSEMELPDTATFNSGDGGKTSVQFMSDRIVVERNKCYRDGGDGVVAISQEIKKYSHLHQKFLPMWWQYLLSCPAVYAKFPPARTKIGRQQN